MVKYTFHPLTLNQYLGTLTTERAVPLLRLKFTPEPPFLEIYDARNFGVEQGSEGFLPRISKSVSLHF